jgi:hypothetical protein
MADVKAILLMILMVLGLAGCMGTSTGSRAFPADGTYGGPGTSFPQIYMNENGDRVGHYPPYYYPDH